MKKQPVNDKMLLKCSVAMWLFSMVLFLIGYIFTRDQNEFFINSIRICMLRDTGTSTSSSSDPVSLITLVVAVITFGLDLKLISTLKKSVFSEDSTILQAIEEAIKIPIWATLASTTMFILMIFVIFISKLLSISPDTFR